MDDRPIQLKDIAAKVGYKPSGFLKAAQRRGFQPFKLQQGGTKPYFLSQQDAEALIRKLEDERNYRVIPDQKKAPTGLSGVYAIGPPSYDGIIRLKIGWSDDVDVRFNTYRNIVPDLRIFRIWPCFENWYELMALKWAKENGRQIGEEIFEFEDNDAAVSSLDDIFVSLGVKPVTTTPQ